MSPATRYRPVTSADVERRARRNRINLTTGLGLVVARAGGATLKPGPAGLILGEGYRWKFPVAGAFTVGNVVTTRHTFEALTAWAPGVVGHESRHASQYARWGLAFLPAYGAAALFSLWRYGDPATGNHFERQAGLVSGAYLATGFLPRPRRSATWASWLRRGRSAERADAAPTGGPDEPRADAPAA